MQADEIHAEILASGAITVQSADGPTHHILREGRNCADLECAADGHCTLQISIGDEIHRADDTNTPKMASLWQHWRESQ